MGGTTYFLNFSCQKLKLSSTNTSNLKNHTEPSQSLHKMRFKHASLGDPTQAHLSSITPTCYLLTHNLKTKPNNQYNSIKKSR